jgi:hypothetical protein
MALVGNGVRMGGGPHNAYSNAGIQSTERACWNKPGATRCFWAGEATVIGGASIANKNSVPWGYRHPACWLVSPKAGGLSSYQIAVGTGTVAGANLAGGKNAEALLAGSSTLTAEGQLVVSGAATLTGTGTIAGADLRAVLNGEATLSASGTVTGATLSALGWTTANVSASGTITGAALTATGTLAAAIVITYTATATTEDVAQAVWDLALESGFPAERIIRIIAAAAAGKSSGGPGSPVFRNLTDTQDQITGTADGSGNRSAASFGA